MKKVLMASVMVGTFFTGCGVYHQPSVDYAVEHNI